MEDNPEKDKAQKQRWRERKRACAPEQEMWVQKSSLNLHSCTIYPRMKELVMLLTAYKKVPSLLSQKKAQELETRLAEHREKHRIRQRKYDRKRAEKRKLESHCVPRKERISEPKTQQQDRQ